jgi:hypothetical protein
LKLNLLLAAKFFAHRMIHDAKAAAHLLLDDPRAAVGRLIRVLT